jgi:hypothetical protein
VNTVLILLYTHPSARPLPPPPSPAPRVQWADVIWREVITKGREKWEIWKKKEYRLIVKLGDALNKCIRGRKGKTCA